MRASLCPRLFKLSQSAFLVFLTHKFLTKSVSFLPPTSCHTAPLSLLYILYPIRNHPRFFPTCLIMRSGHALFLAALSLSLTQCTSASFYLKEKWVGEDFFRDWNWETENDPTDGRVNYVSQAEAIAKNLAYGTSSSRFSRISLDNSNPLVRNSFKVENDAFVMRADDWSIVDPSARGRDSIRISSQNAYSESIFVLDLAHMPAGCATWPAFWTNSQKGPWPDGGEVDIIEGTLLVSFVSLPSYP